MIQIDLTQYSKTARNDLCMALYRMTERHCQRPETSAEAMKGGERNEQGIHAPLS